MRLSTDPPDLNPNRGRVFRHSPLADLLATVVAFGALAGGGYALARMWGELPWFLWAVIGPLVLLGGSLLLLVAFSMLDAFRSSLKPTNWLAFVVSDGVFLNLRSYRNGHFTGDDPTVVFLEFREVQSVGRVAEKRTETHDHKNRTSIAKMIELRTSGIDTRPIADACRAERNHPAPTRRLLGVTSRTKHHHVPVFVPERGVVRVEWHGGLYRALARHVDEAEPRGVDLDAELGSLPPEERGAQLVLRGRRLAAARIARDELGLDSREAREWVREMSRQAA